MKTRKNNKALTVGIALAAVAITGVAFSTYIVNLTQGNTTPNINVVVGDVVNHSLVIQDPTVDGKLNFDCKADDTTGPIIYSSDGNGGESLSFTINFEIVGARENNTQNLASHFGGFTVSLSAGEGGADNSVFASMTSNNYITSPEFGTDITINKPTSLTTGSNVVTQSPFTATYTANEGENTIVDVALKVEFGWGSYFSNANPGDYAGSDASTVSNYVNALNTLKTSLNSKTLTVTLTPLLADSAA